MVMVPTGSEPAAPSPAAPPPVATQHPVQCTNCGATVSGKYCSACGQRVEYRLHSLWDLLGEATEVLTHADSRLWRTLGPLLFRPGFLTQRFLEGHRASYLSPFRLYLVLSVVFFLVVSIVGSPPRQSARPTSAVPSTASGAPRVSPPPPADASQGQAANRTGHEPRATADELCEEAVGHMQIPGTEPLRRPFLTACLESQADDGRELHENFIRNLGRAMFLFLPLLAGFMKLLYWRPARSYVTHLLLLMHNHACVFLVLSVVVAALHWIPAEHASRVPVVVVVGYLIAYLYRSMHRVYAENWWQTLLKFTALSVAYLACAACTVLLAGLYSAETL